MLRPLLMLRARGLGIVSQRVANLTNHVVHGTGPKISVDTLNLHMHHVVEPDDGDDGDDGDDEENE